MPARVQYTYNVHISTAYTTYLLVCSMYRYVADGYTVLPLFLSLFCPLYLFVIQIFPYSKSDAKRNWRQRPNGERTHIRLRWTKCTKFCLCWRRRVRTFAFPLWMTVTYKSCAHNAQHFQSIFRFVSLQTNWRIVFGFSRRRQKYFHRSNSLLNQSSSLNEICWVKKREKKLFDIQSIWWVNNVY